VSLVQSATAKFLPVAKKYESSTGDCTAITTQFAQSSPTIQGPISSRRGKRFPAATFSQSQWHNTRSTSRRSFSAVRAALACGNSAISSQSYAPSVNETEPNRGFQSNLARSLPSAAFRFPFILRLRVPDCLPLHVRGCVRSSAHERHDVILDVTGASAARQLGRLTRMRQLELALDRGRALPPCRSGDWKSDADG